MLIQWAGYPAQVAGQDVKPGQVIDLPEAAAAQLITEGLAEPVPTTSQPPPPITIPTIPPLED